MGMPSRVGKSEWARTFAAWLLLGSFFAYWTAARLSPTIDVASFFANQLLFVGVFVSAALFVLRRWGFAWPMIWQKTLMWTPLAALPGVVDFFWRWAFPAWRPTYAAGVHFIIPFLTLGLFPRPLASVGTSIALIAALGLIWRWIRTVLPMKKALWCVASLAAVWSSMLCAPSLVGWMHAAFGPKSTPFYGTSLEVERSLSAMATDSYWGQGAYRRFSAPIGNEARTSVERLFASLAFLLLVFGAWTVSPFARLSWRDRFAFLRPELAMAFGAFAVFGWGTGFVPTVSGVWRFGTFAALAVFLVTMLAAWMSSVGRNDIFDLAEDERRNADRPLARGVLQMADLQEALPLLLATALVGGWILGWPIFAAVAIFLAASELYSATPFRGKENFAFHVGLLAASAFAFVLASWFFARAEGDWANIPLPLFFGLFASLALFAMVRSERYSESVWLHRGLLFAGFLAPAAALFSLPWTLFGAVFGLAAVFYISHGASKLSIVWRLIWLYYGLSGLLFASHWLTIANS